MDRRRDRSDLVEAITVNIMYIARDFLNLIKVVEEVILETIKKKG